MKRFLVILVSIFMLVSLTTTGMADGPADYSGQFVNTSGLEDGKYYFYYGGQFFEVDLSTLVFLLQMQQQGSAYPTSPALTPVPTMQPGQWSQSTTQYGYNYAYSVRKDVKVYSDENCNNSIASLGFGQAVQVIWRQQGQKTMRVQLVDGSAFNGYVKVADMCKPLYKLNLRDMVFFGTTINFSVKSYGSAAGGYRNNEEALVLYEEGDYYFIVADSGCSGWVKKSSGGIEVVESCQYESINTWYWSTYRDYYTRNQIDTGNYAVARPSLNLFTKANQASQRTGSSVKFLEQPEILEDDGEWLYVRKADGSEGYIRKAYFCDYRELFLRINQSILCLSLE